jgi:hypothetical protein
MRLTVGFMALSVVVHDFDIFRAGGCPDETYAPLPIDADAVLAGAVVFQRFQLVARRRAQELQRMRGIELGQLADGRTLNGTDSSRMATLEQRLRVLAAEAPDRQWRLLRLALYVKESPV